MRPVHCTSGGLTFAIVPNVNDSGAQFLVVGELRPRAPLKFNEKYKNLQCKSLLHVTFAIILLITTILCFVLIVFTATVGLLKKVRK